MLVIIINQQSHLLPQHVFSPIHHLLNPPPLPQQLESHQARLVVQVLEARLAARDHVVLVVRQLQCPVDADSDGHASLLRVLKQIDSINIFSNLKFSQDAELKNILSYGIELEKPFSGNLD